MFDFSMVLVCLYMCSPNLSLFCKNKDVDETWVLDNAMGKILFHRINENQCIKLIFKDLLHMLIHIIQLITNRGFIIILAARNFWKSNYYDTHCCF